MKHILFLILMFITTTSVYAEGVDSLKTIADSAYAKENFSKAAGMYEKLSREGQSATICYNLGNCYYRMDEMAKAVLWYERASLLDPGDADIRFNLDLARSKTIDKVVPQSELFFVNWYGAITNMFGVDVWAYICLGLFVFSIVALFVYLFCSSLLLRKAGFAGFTLLLILCVLSNIFAWSQKQRLIKRDSAIVMSSVAVIKSTPSQTGNDLFVIHEGTKVNILDRSLEGWYEVKLADGKVGWIQAKQIEVI